MYVLKVLWVRETMMAVYSSKSHQILAAALRFAGLRRVFRALVF